MRSTTDRALEIADYLCERYDASATDDGDENPLTHYIAKELEAVRRAGLEDVKKEINDYLLAQGLSNQWDEMSDMNKATYVVCDNLKGIVFKMIEQRT